MREIAEMLDSRRAIVRKLGILRKIAGRRGIQLKIAELRDTRAGAKELVTKQ